MHPSISSYKNYNQYSRFLVEFGFIQPMSLSPCLVASSPPHSQRPNRDLADLAGSSGSTSVASRTGPSCERTKPRAANSPRSAAKPTELPTSWEAWETPAKLVHHIFHEEYKHEIARGSARLKAGKFMRRFEDPTALN